MISLVLYKEIELVFEFGEEFTCDSDKLELFSYIIFASEFILYSEYTKVFI